MAEVDLWSGVRDVFADELSAAVNKVPGPRAALFTAAIWPMLQRAFSARAWGLFDKRWLYKKGMTIPSIQSVCFITLEADTGDAIAALSAMNGPGRYLLAVPRVDPLLTVPPEIEVIDVHLDILALEPDYWEVPLCGAFKRCFADNDVSDVFAIGRALLRAQVMHGRAPKLVGMGPVAQRVVKYVRAQLDELGSMHVGECGKFDGIYVLDRIVDLVTPLMSQMTYGGLVDERYGPRWGVIKVPAGVKPPEEGMDEVIVTDSVYRDFRGLDLQAVSERLKAVAAEMAEMEAALKDAVGDVDKFVVAGRRGAQLAREKPWVELHQQLAEQVCSVPRLLRASFNFEFACLRRDERDRRLPWRFMGNQRVLDALRLAALDSVCSAGVSDSRFTAATRRVANALGQAGVEGLAAMERSGLFTQRGGLFEKRAPFDIVRVDLNLAPEEGTDELAASYAGYVPLSVRLIQLALTGGWSRVEKALSTLGLPSKVIERPAARRSGRVLVFFVGGCTDSELSLLQAVGRSVDIEVHVASTGLQSGARLIGELCPAAVRGVVIGA